MASVLDDRNPQLVTNIPPAIKAKISAYRNAILSVPIFTDMNKDDLMTVRVARYNLERCIATHLGRVPTEGR